MSDALERRYRRLMRAYPARYRAERGEEIVATFLDGAEPGRRWPGAGDAADLVFAGLRERARPAAATGLVPGAHLAGTVALSVAAGLSVLYLPREVHRPEWWVRATFGPFTTVGVAVWVAWLVALAGAVVLPGRWARWPAGAALVVNAAALVAPAVTELARPPLVLLLPQLALGAVALLLPARRSRWARFGVALPAAGALLPALAGWWSSQGLYNDYYSGLGQEFLPSIGLCVLAGCGLVGPGYLARRDARVLWAGVLLLPAAGLLAVVPIAQSGPLNPARNGWPGWDRLAAAAVLVVAVSVAAFVAAVALALTARRRRSGAAPRTPCPTCGRVD